MSKRELGWYFLALCSFPAWGATYYVDAERGLDENNGTSEATAWRSLERVNTAPLVAGDAVQFKCNQLWRGQLVPKSGEAGKPICYTAYGTGAKPILQGSLDRSRSDDWVSIGNGVWATQPFEPKRVGAVTNVVLSDWSCHDENDAKATLSNPVENGLRFHRVTCVRSGTRSNYIQLWGPRFDGASSCLLVQMRVRSSKPFALKNMEIMRAVSPYTHALECTSKQIIGTEWQTLNLVFTSVGCVDQARLHLNLGAKIPDGAQFDFVIDQVALGDLSHCAPVTLDVGIFIGDHGKAWGWKKWTLVDLKDHLDYWYDAENKRVFVKSEKNPAEVFKSIELALTRHIINQGGAHDVIYDGLAVRYGGAHGFGGGNTKRLIIRKCDVYWIGGGLQFFHPNGRPVRYGNGIEFWGAASDHLVESNRLWEVYDAALTNQGNGDDSNQINITYRNNVIWNAEYSFEFWNRPEAVKSHNIVFENNTCVNAGFAWSHAQRPDKNGAHLMFYQHPSQTKGVVVRNNIFCETTEVCMRMENDWRSGLTLANNLYYTSGKPIYRWLSKQHFATLKECQSATGLDMNGLEAKPLFVDDAKHDYRLKPESPGFAQKIGAQF